MIPTTNAGTSAMDAFHRALSTSEEPISSLIAGGSSPDDAPITDGLFAEPAPDSQMETLPAELPPLNDEEAHRLIRRLARYDDEQAALKANYQVLTREIEEKRAWVLGNEGLRLQEWVAAQLRGKRRSVRTLHGVAGFRAQAARLVILDEGRALEWAREALPAAIVEKLDGKRIDLAEFLAINERGEPEYAPPNGLAVEPGGDKFYVKSGGKGGSGDDE